MEGDGGRCGELAAVRRLDHVLERASACVELLLDESCGRRVRRHLADPGRHLRRVHREGEDGAAAHLHARTHVTDHRGVVWGWSVHREGEDGAAAHLLDDLVACI